jgi:hypothetical protein
MQPVLAKKTAVLLSFSAIPHAARPGRHTGNNCLFYPIMLDEILTSDAHFIIMVVIRQTCEMRITDYIGRVVSIETVSSYDSHTFH